MWRPGCGSIRPDRIASPLLGSRAKHLEKRDRIDNRHTRNGFQFKQVPIPRHEVIRLMDDGEGQEIVIFWITRNPWRFLLQERKRMSKCQQIVEERVYRFAA